MSARGAGVLLSVATVLLPVLCSAALLLSAGCRGRADRMEHDLRDTSPPPRRQPVSRSSLPERRHAGGGRDLRDPLVRPGRHANQSRRAMGGKDKGMLLVGAPAQPDSLVWKIPVGFVTGFGVASSDQVRLRLEDADSAGYYVEASPFTVRGVGRR